MPIILCRGIDPWIDPCFIPLLGNVYQNHFIPVDIDPIAVNPPDKYLVSSLA